MTGLTRCRSKPASCDSRRSTSPPHPVSAMSTTSRRPHRGGSPARPRSRRASACRGPSARRRDGISRSPRWRSRRRTRCSTSLPSSRSIMRERLRGVAVVVDHEDAPRRRGCAARGRVAARLRRRGARRDARQPHDELAALAGPVAVRLHGAAVQLDQLPHEREARGRGRLARRRASRCPGRTSRTRAAGRAPRCPCPRRGRATTTSPSSRSTRQRDARRRSGCTSRRC